MIHNFTEAEWKALVLAVDSREIELDDLHATQEKATLNRAFEKARQLAPER